ncbi:hypothetical protein FRB99_002406 [Tulasnella sp. 403]|nr:hypothetical protein FRB99_002406 [Tulasnella sp. 403]
MSSFHSAVDMENVQMSMDIAGAIASAFPVDRLGLSDGDNMVVNTSSAMDPTNPASFGFTDPNVLNQITEMEEEVKFPVAYSLDQSALGSLPSAVMPPVAFSQPQQLAMASPPSTHASGHSPGHLSQSHSTPGPRDNSNMHSTISSTGSPSVASSSNVPSTRAGGIPMSGIIPTRDGTQVTVGSVVASVLDNVVQMASQARDAYLAGRQEQTHIQIEEMLESLKLVGGLGIGPSIGTVLSNRANPDEGDPATGLADVDASMAASAPVVTSSAAMGLGGASSTSPHGKRTSAHLSRSAGSNSASPQSSVSPPQRYQTVLSGFNPSMEGLGLAHTSSASPPAPAPSGSLTGAMGPLPTMDDGPSELAMAMIPSVASFDPSRKRTTASAPTLEDSFRGPAKFTKLSPPTGNADEAVLSGTAASAATLANKPIPGSAPLTVPPSALTLQPPAPPLMHAHTFPGMAAQQVPGPPVPVAAPSSLFSPHMAQAVPSGLPGAMGVPMSTVAGSSSLAGVPQSSSTYPAVVASALGSGWPLDTSTPPPAGVVIPPPHTSPERRYGSDPLSGYRPGSLFPANGATPVVDSIPLPVSSLTQSASQMGQSIVDETMETGLPMGKLMRTASVSDLPAAANLMDCDPTLSGYSTTGGLVGMPNPVMPRGLPGQGDQFPSAVPSMAMDMSLPAPPTVRPSTSGGRPSPPSAAPFPTKHENSSPDGSDEENDDDDSDDGDDDGPNGYHHSGSVNGSTAGRRRGSMLESKHPKRRSGGGGENSGSAHALSPELKAEVDRIFLEYLNRICSNLEATDSKGEVIHQTLMAKKMARLDESPDFRPFKFRIQAFTNGFVEELARQGYGEDQIPIKKTKAYLWHHNPYIARFNEDGKKAKSKGNHIWNIEAKKLHVASNGDPSQPRWIFKKFVRKIAGSPPSMAYIGLKWTWEPKIWDPQLSRASIEVEFSSPNMPPWMRWEKGVLVGVPTPDSHSTDLTVEARFLQDGQEKVLSVTHPITVAPLAVGDSSYPKNRRPSLLSSDAMSARRFVSDSVVPQTAPARIPMVPATALPPPVPTPAETAQVIAVINSAAHRVAQEAHSQSVQSIGPAQAHTQAALAKQQQVLSMTAKVISDEAHDALVGRSHGEQPKAASVLVQAAQAVVHQAARQVQADKTAVAILQSKNSPVSIAPFTPAPVSLTDVSIATQSAVAHAVAITGSQSSEVEVMLTANSLIQQRSRADSRAGMSMHPPSTNQPGMAAPSGPQATVAVPPNQFPHTLVTPTAQFLR